MRSIGIYVTASVLISSVFACSLQSSGSEGNGEGTSEVRGEPPQGDSTDDGGAARDRVGNDAMARASDAAGTCNLVAMPSTLDLGSSVCEGKVGSLTTCSNTVDGQFTLKNIGTGPCASVGLSINQSDASEDANDFSFPESEGPAAGPFNIAAGQTMQIPAHFAQTITRKLGADLVETFKASILARNLVNDNIDSEVTVDVIFKRTVRALPGDGDPGSCHLVAVTPSLNLGSVVCEGKVGSLTTCNNTAEGRFTLKNIGTGPCLSVRVAIRQNDASGDTDDFRLFPDRSFNIAAGQTLQPLVVGFAQTLTRKLGADFVETYKASIVARNVVNDVLDSEVTGDVIFKLTVHALPAGK